MSKNKKKRKFKKRNRIMATIAENDPKRFRQRTVKPERGKGRKERPRQNNWSEDAPLLAA